MNAVTGQTVHELTVAWIPHALSHGVTRVVLVVVTLFTKTHRIGDQQERLIPTVRSVAGRAGEAVGMGRVTTRLVRRRSPRIMAGETETLRRFVQQTGLVAGVRIVAGRAVAPTGGNVGENGQPRLSHLVLVTIPAELVESRHDAEWSFRARR